MTVVKITYDGGEAGAVEVNGEVLLIDTDRPPKISFDELGNPQVRVTLLPDRLIVGNSESV